jgi:hypothetical protein
MKRHLRNVHWRSQVSQLTYAYILCLYALHISYYPYTSTYHLSICFPCTYMHTIPIPISIPIPTIKCFCVDFY